MNPLSAPHTYYWESLTEPLPCLEEIKAGNYLGFDIKLPDITSDFMLELIKKVVLAASGILLIPLFGIMKLIGDKLSVNTAVVFVKPCEAFNFTVDKTTSIYKHNGYMIEAYD